MEKPLTQHIKAGREPLTIREYEEVGGYGALRKALKMSPKEIQEEVTKSDLKGRGGAGFPTGKKWSVIPMGDESHEKKYLVVNADEMEPGTMKDRLLMEGAPHQLIEGAIISAYAVQASICFIFLRWAYKLAEKRLTKAIAEAYEKNYLGKNIQGSSFSLELYLHVSAGRYMCGEETALLNVLEGRRAVPRNKPPYPPFCGLWGKPTLFNNVETISNIPHIINNGAQWYKSLSKTEDGGTKIYGVSGRVKRPGLWELPMGTTIGEIFYEHAGGMCDGYEFRGLIPGGGSTEFLVDSPFEVKMDYDSVQNAGSRLGTGTMIILDNRICPISVLLCLEQFFARESCGWCTPCREGLPWVTNILEAIENGRGKATDIEILETHTRYIKLGHTFCALAPGAMEPLASGLKYFRKDFEYHINEKKCPWSG